MKYIFKETMKLIIISILITVFWQGLELLITGEITHRIVDDVIGLILTFSLYFNLNNFLKRGKKL